MQAASLSRFRCRCIISYVSSVRSALRGVFGREKSAKNLQERSLTLCMRLWICWILPWWDSKTWSNRKLLSEQTWGSSWEQRSNLRAFVNISRETSCASFCSAVTLSQVSDLPCCCSTHNPCRNMKQDWCFAWSSPSFINVDVQRYILSSFLCPLRYTGKIWGASVMNMPRRLSCRKAATLKCKEGETEHTIEDAMLFLLKRQSLLFETERITLTKYKQESLRQMDHMQSRLERVRQLRDLNNLWVKDALRSCFM